MTLMRLVPIYQEPETSKNHPAHKIYRSPLFLNQWRTMAAFSETCLSPDQTRAGAPTSPISPLPADLPCKSPARQWMWRGFLYLVAILDWYSRKVLRWRLSNSSA
jgi:putative transposase